MPGRKAAVTAVGRNARVMVPVSSPKLRSFRENRRKITDNTFRNMVYVLDPRLVRFEFDHALPLALERCCRTLPTAFHQGDSIMRRMAACVCAVCLLCSPGCRVVSNCLRDTIFGGLAEEYDSSRPNREERRMAYDRYVREHVDP
jgi:hypothetical protein